MEKGEVDATKFYDSITDKYPQALKIKEDEEEHEQRLIGILNDDRLNYAGAIVLGLNDGLVEFTGPWQDLPLLLPIISSLAVQD